MLKFLTVLVVVWRVCTSAPYQFPGGDNTADGLFEGDIKLTKLQEEAVNRAIKNQKTGDGSKGFGLTNVYPPWKNGVVVYTFDRSIGSSQSTAIYAAMKEWTSKTQNCITFKRRTNERNYLKFYVGNGCWGHLGQPNGESQISVGRGCDRQNVMSHEIGHALGFWHEQSRTDRDQYVQILWNNVPGSFKSAFEKYGRDKIDSLGVPYDYTSIMHYPWNAFSTNGRNTLKPIRNVPRPGPYVHISDSDVKQAKLFYKCSGVKPATKKPPVPPTAGPTKTLPPVTKCEDGGSGSTCVDKNRYCSGWATRGECTRNPDYMTTNCCRSCSSGSCADKNRLCSAWSRRGECSRNPSYMNVNCKRSCGRCTTTRKCYTVTLPPTKPPPPQPKTQLPPPPEFDTLS